jgi:hypothetical protein
MSLTCTDDSYWRNSLSARGTAGAPRSLAAKFPLLDAEGGVREGGDVELAGFHSTEDEAGQRTRADAIRTWQAARRR